MLRVLTCCRSVPALRAHQPSPRSAVCDGGAGSVLLGVSLGVLLGVLLGVAACGGSPSATPDAPEIAFDRAGLLRRLGTDYLAPRYQVAAQAATALRDATGSYCTALATNTEVATKRQQALHAFAAANSAWQVLEPIAVGPALRNSSALRNRIYSWPLAAPCAIDRDVVLLATNPTQYDVTARLDNARSLTAMEYLLHVTDAASSCAVAPPGWAELANRERARCELAQAIAVDVAASAAQLAAAWSPTGEDYAAHLAAAGQAGSMIASQREALNMVSDALFYLETMVKDMKIGEAAGISMNVCGTVDEACVREAELRYANLGTPSLRQNLQSWRAAFSGSFDGVDGLGFDDYLAAAGAPDVAARMLAEIDNAIASATALPDDFLATLASQRAQLVALYGQVKAVTDDQKSQFLTLLGLDIPDDIATDND